jgi:isoleucyl-tRNA synthetase
MFNPVESTTNFPKQELAVGQFWKENRIYEKSLEQRAGAPPFVFYEGPPTANGMPHPGHCLTRAIKDLFPRYRTMRGYRCERKAGWDTHGLPVEVEVCKELGIHSKEEIEAYGIEPFIQKCQQSVWRYMKEWERMTDRIGFWVDLKNAYATYHQSYVESVWWSLKDLYDRNLLYQGHKIVWWWAQGGTALSAGEVGEGYRSVADPSVYVELRLDQQETIEVDGVSAYECLVVWTTTPWTLPANQYVAVKPELEYSVVVFKGYDSPVHNAYIIASELMESFTKKFAGAHAVSVDGLDAKVVRTCVGSELVGRCYCPPFEWYTRANREPNYSDSKGRLRTGKDEALYWRIIAADFVTTDTGTGLVHIAPAFGEDDHGVLLSEQARFAPDEGPKLFLPVDSNGKYNAHADPTFQNRWVKDCDKDLIQSLKESGKLALREQYVHDYPFCPRAEQDALIQYPRQSWFIRTSDFKGDMLANNDKINWLPEHIKTGRFGKFLETNVDWALSRERYWGTPLPIWKCQETGQMEAVGSYDELMSKPGIRGGEVWEEAKRRNPELPDDLRIHKPYIDEIVYDSPFTKDAHMRRVPEVIDCWYDAGSMPFAQWGFPHTEGSDKHFKSQFPADFISEAIDQTRGWFYAQLAISTLMFGVEQGAGSKEQEKTLGLHAPSSQLHAPSSQLHAPYPHPFRNCIVLGHMLGEDGLKMSKRKRNYLPPDEIFDRYGADALRWYFFANQPPWTSIRYNEQSIKDSIPEFLLRLWNVYSFFVIYANIDGFNPAIEFEEGIWVEGSKPEFPIDVHPGLDRQLFAGVKSCRPVSDRNELDRWILSELNRTCAAVVERMDAYDNYAACGHITAFVDALSNWYVRRSRDRFWAADKRGQEKLDAYWTLYEALVTTTKLVAPFVPFLAETLWQNVTGVFKSRPESVHLTDYPTGDPSASDEALSARMNLVREISSLGRNARGAANLKVRQPLAKVEVVLADTTHQKWLQEHAALIAEELNVKEVAFTTHGEEYITYSVVPNFKRLGPRIGKNLPAAKKALAEADASKLLAELKADNKTTLKLPTGDSIDLDNEDIEVRLAAKAGWAAAQGKASVVVLSTELTQELVDEGAARDVVRLVQDRRKDTGCDYTDRIEVGIVTESTELQRAVEQFRDFIMAETLANQIVFKPLPNVEAIDTKVGDAALQLFIRVVR